jgi:hypothetical protein
VYVWGLVTVVNCTQLPMKITSLRLLMAAEEQPVRSISFHLNPIPPTNWIELA